MTNCEECAERWVWKKDLPDWKEQGYGTIYISCDDERRID